jgi:hypothetical protein
MDRLILIIIAIGIIVCAGLWIVEQKNNTIMEQCQNQDIIGYFIANNDTTGTLCNWIGDAMAMRMVSLKDTIIIFNGQVTEAKVRLMRGTYYRDILSSDKNFIMVDGEPHKLSNEDVDASNNPTGPYRNWYENQIILLKK